MAVTIYPPQCEDFSTNGLGVLAPLRCTVEKQAGGMYELKLVHPIDDTLRWAQITAGCIVKAPVPVRETPMYTYMEDVTDGETVKVQRRVYRVKTNGGRLHLRQKPSTSAKILAKYNQGTEVVRLADVGGGWFQVSVCNGGAKGYMYSQWLQYVRTVTETVSQARVVGQRAVELLQSREQLFRVTVVETDTEAGTVTATAQHIFYDLRGNLVSEAYEPKKKAVGTVAADVMGKLLNPTDFELHAEHVEGKVSGDYGFKSPVEILLDPDEGLAVQTGALVVRDNYDVYLLPDAVRDDGVTVRRGKNLRGVTVTNDMTDVVTRIIPEGKTSDGKPLYISGRYVDSPRIGDYPTIYAQRIEYDVKVVNKDADGETTFGSNSAARAKLKKLAEADFAENGADLPAYGMEVDFALLREPEEYAALRSVYLYDTVTVIDELIGLKAKVRVTGYTWDALSCQYEKVTLGELQELKQTVYSYNLPNRGISGGKIANNSMEGVALRDLSVDYAKISVAAIGQLMADSITALTARIREIVADQVYTDELYAVLAELNRAIIQRADIQWADIESLQAAVAKIARAAIGTADIDWAQIRDLITGTAIITQGEAGKLFISRLAVTEANMVSLTTGELVVKGADGRFYAITVDAEGNIRAELKQIGNGDVADGSIDAGEKIIEGSVTAACLNATEIFADSAVIRELIAANLDVDRLFAREAFVNLLRTAKIVGGTTLELAVQNAADTAADAMEAAEAARSAADDVGERVQDCVTHPEQETYLRMRAEGVYVGRTNSVAEAFINAAGSFEVLVNGESVTKLGNRMQQLGGLIIYETGDGGHALI